VATTVASTQTDWRQEWFEIEDATYLNMASQSRCEVPFARCSRRSKRTKTHHKTDSTFFEVPNRLRASIAKLIGGKPKSCADDRSKRGRLRRLRTR